ncbi:site-specific DNA-methyltransferase [Paraburkholderia sp. Cpub6]|uniref:site-specific DNA-methyltransferase n=1 Tax=Paraburkholderia sp. Cpub6 TaxID=2723094 RepID=UPI0017B6DECC|nr:adenine-specific DNA-methyltransferase [Paraburkholderia sp. Cpub6]
MKDTKMQKIEATSLEAQSANVAADNLAQLKALFPELVTEGPNGPAINMDVLKALVGDATVTDAEEKYGLNWHGKRAARQLALTPSTGTLRPCPDESVDWETTKNLMIEGDNLEVLKLLQKSYAGKVKLVYIDPPYNTGKDFVYPDNYQDNIKNYLELTGQAEGGQKISSNTEASGRFHTDWLNMIYPRLKVAKSLLDPAGAVMVSCDDNELSRLRIVMDELFGEENFVGQVIWQRSKKGDAKLIATVHEYIVCYVRDKAAVLAQGVWRLPKEGADEVLAKYTELKAELKSDHQAIRPAMMEWYRQLPEGDPRKSHKHYNWSDDRGLYFAADFAGPDDGRESRPRHDILHPTTGRPCKKPSTGWRWDEDKTNWALAQVPPRIHFGPDETTIPTRKSYLFEIDSEPFSSVFYRDGRSATLEVEELVGKGWFQFPKNTDVLAELIELTTKPDDIVLDFFAGSGSTGHAIYKVNAAHGSKRRYVLVQLPEPTGKEQFKTIADITRKRLREASAKLKRSGGAPLGDLGFRVFKLDHSNIRAWNPSPADLEATLFSHQDHLLDGRSENDVLYELLLKLGLDLCVPMERRTFDGKVVHAVGRGVLLACLSTTIASHDVEALAHGIVTWHDELAPAGDTTCVFRDSAFADDVAKTNMAAILHQHGIVNVRSL